MLNHGAATRLDITSAMLIILGGRNDSVVMRAAGAVRSLAAVAITWRDLAKLSRSGDTSTIAVRTVSRALPTMLPLSLIHLTPRSRRLERRPPSLIGRL